MNYEIRDIFLAVISALGTLSVSVISSTVSLTSGGGCYDETAGGSVEEVQVGAGSVLSCEELDSVTVNCS